MSKIWASEIKCDHFEKSYILCQYERNSLILGTTRLSQLFSQNIIIILSINFIFDVCFVCIFIIWFILLCLDVGGDKRDQSLKKSYLPIIFRQHKNILQLF